MKQNKLIPLLLCFAIFLGMYDSPYINAAARRITHTNMLLLKLKGFCENGPWDFFIDKEGHPYMLEWDICFL